MSVPISLRQRAREMPTKMASGPLLTRELLPLVGPAREAAREEQGFWQPLSRGLLFWREQPNGLLALHADGRTTCAHGVEPPAGLGEPLGPVLPLRLVVQRCRRATLVWSRPTGLVLLYPGRWELALGQ